MIPQPVWVGADPGGRENFGLAILGADGTALAVCVDSCDDAMAVVGQHVKGTVAGIGVDAPLWWSSGRSSDRRADQWIRRTFKLSGGQVQGGNSLRGAALIQGLLFVSRMREKFPGVPVTETHPKALLKALRLPDWPAIAERFQVTYVADAIREHERDAIVGAVAAREGFEGRWNTDLSLDRFPSEQDPDEYWLKPVRYWWPHGEEVRPSDFV